MKVEFEDILKINEIRRKINKCDFEDLRIYQNGYRVELTEEMKGAYKYTGLLNTDLIELFVNELNKDKP